MAGKKQSPFEDLIDITAKLPWWAGVLLAVVAYLGLHAYATRDIAPPADIHNIAANFSPNIYRTIAVFGQYILPLVFLLGAFLSGSRQITRRNLRRKVAESPTRGVLNHMSWQQFESLVGDYYRDHGYQVSERGGSGPDGGVDLVLIKENQKYLVQCKQWQAYKVGVKPVRELLGVMVGEKATGGIVITSGSFTSDAIAFAEDNNIRLIDGTEFHKMTAKSPQSPDIHIPFKPKEKPDLRFNALFPIKKVAKCPVCDKCGSRMVLRTARNGINVGNKFWGCSHYPICKNTLPYKRSAKKGMTV